MQLLHITVLAHDVCMLVAEACHRKLFPGLQLLLCELLVLTDVVSNTKPMIKCFSTFHMSINSKIILVNLAAVACPSVSFSILSKISIFLWVAVNSIAQLLKKFRHVLNHVASFHPSAINTYCFQKFL